MNAEDLQNQIVALQNQVAELRGQQMEHFENEDDLMGFLDAQVNRRTKVPRNVSKLRKLVRQTTLNHLEAELRKRHTPLFQRAFKKKLSADGKRVRKKYAELHYATFINMVRAPLRQLLGDNISNEQMCKKVCLLRNLTYTRIH